MAILLSGRVFSDAGTGLNGASITVYPAASDTPTDTTTTGNDSHGKAGYWEFADLAAGVYKVKIEYNGKTRWLNGETGSQFQEINVGKAVQITDDGNVALVNPTDPTDGSSVDSPSITLTGAYDSNAGVGAVTRTDKSVSIVNDVANDGTYKLSIRDTSGTEKVSITSGGLLDAAGGLKVGGVAALIDTDRATMNVDQVDGKHASDFATAAHVHAAADLLTAIKTVDGADSGLDADKLDGVELTGVRCNAYTQYENVTTSYTGTTTLITQSVTLTARSWVVVNGSIGFTASSTADKPYSASIRRDGNLVRRWEGYHNTGSPFDCGGMRGMLLNAGTYSFTLEGYAGTGATAQIYHDTDRTFLDVMVFPTNS